MRLHGDAHVEQFALSADAWGLEDFDDSARGPALIDIVRFLGSIDLATRQRGWTRDRDVVFDRFFTGYRRGLTEPDYQPPVPDIVRHFRAEAPRTRAAFLVWGETKMEPMADASIEAVEAGMEVFSRLILRERPDLAPDYFRVMRAGWLRMGIGSAVAKKVLVRVQGPSPDPTDDELLEGKVVGYLGGLSCLDEPESVPTLRVIDGARQLGRMKHNILAAGPELVVPEVVLRAEQLHDWWIRSWDPSYREVHISDLRSVKDLDAIAFDAGLQLGAGSFQEEVGEQSGSARERAWTSVANLDRRIRKETLAIVEDLFLGWQEFRKR